ncbi:MAG: bifunctional riboflavin kinase/FAD synthetase [Oscillospiraceae bacterium]|nr:bifunctional riboflavin kinase/FAD synthetase [Oscillospiraceae bacterium]
MKILKNINSRINEKTAVALGNFDGFHVGHMKLIEEIKKYAADNNLASCVWTFSQHSANILNENDDYIKYITSQEEKIGILNENNIDYLVFADFNSVRFLTPGEFIENIIADYLNAEFTVCGFDYRFGRNKEGNAEFLEENLSRKNIKTSVIPPVICDNLTVSSSLIREFIQSGDMRRTKKFLGRLFSINFPVIYGRQIGRQIGAPTINQIFPPGHIIPAPGVYVSLCEVDKKTYKGVTNIGVRPTINNNNKIIAETHIIDFAGDLYGEKIKVSFGEKIRDEIKFADLSNLREQIRKDIETARGY